MRAWTVLLLAMSLGCTVDKDDLFDPLVDPSVDPIPTDTDGVPIDTEDDPDPIEADGPGDGPLGFIGAPCTSDDDCTYDGGLCLLEDEGYPYGSCSAPCDQFCDDDPDAPVTLCVTVDDLPTETPSSIDAGACLSRCDFGTFATTGCRPGYGCAITARPQIGGGEANYACLPARAPDLSGCHTTLAAAGVPFEPSLRPADHPVDRQDLTCDIADPVWIIGPIDGVSLASSGGDPTPRVLTSCEGAIAIADTIDDVVPDGVTVLRHFGSYSCRTIAGSNSLSQHAYADALDIAGFEFDDGTTWTLIDHWEHDTTQPASAAGAWLYDAAERWHDDRLWNIILTPNYNAAHDNHFHVDLTPGADFIGAHDGRCPGLLETVD